MNFCKVTRARLIESPTSIFTKGGARGRVWELDLECGRVISHRVRYRKERTPFDVNYAWYARHSDDLLPAPKCVKCSCRQAA